MLSGTHRPHQAGTIDLDSPRYKNRHASNVSTRKQGAKLCWIVAIALSALAGCGGGIKTVPMGEVYGKITIAGKPLSEGRVNLISGKLGTGASGELKADGTYALDGSLPLGVYDVFITFDIPPSKRGTAAEDVLKTVPPKYLGQTTSRLTAEVKTGRIEYNYDLK